MSCAATLDQALLVLQQADDEHRRDCPQCQKAKEPRDRCDLGQELENALDATRGARDAA